MLFYKVYLPFTIGLVIGVVSAFVVFHVVRRGRMVHPVAGERVGPVKGVAEGEHPPKILCWMMVSPERRDAKHVKQTWGRRCDQLLFMSSSEEVSDPDLPTVLLNVSGDWKADCKRNIEALHYIYNNYLDEVDWVLETDGDAYIVMDNLRYLLSNHDSSSPVYFGSSQDFMGGGIGFVLSKGALRTIVEEGLLNVIYCNRNSIGVDKLWFSLLEVLSVRPLDVVECQWRNRLFPLSSRVDALRVWYWKTLCYPHPFGPVHVCSDNVISFHPVDWPFKYMLEFTIYGVGRQLRSPVLASHNMSQHALSTKQNMSLFHII